MERFVFVEVEKKQQKKQKEVGKKNKGGSGLRGDETPKGSLFRGSPAALGAIEAFPCVCVVRVRR